MNEKTEFNVYNRFTGEVQFTAEIEWDGVDKNIALGLAVKWAINNSVDLRGADLRYADLRGVNLIVLQLNSRWTAYVTPERTRIGCEEHSNAEWLAFSDDTIQRMDMFALQYWREAKPLVELAIETLKKRGDTK